MAVRPDRLAAFLPWRRNTGGGFSAKRKKLVASVLGGILY
jgi:hypothetical protein